MARVAGCITEAHDAGLAAMGPGKTVDAVDKAIREVVTEAGCDRYAHSRFGYSLGLAFPPTWAQPCRSISSPAQRRCSSPT